MKKFLSLLPALIAISVAAGLGVLVSNTIVSAFGWKGAGAVLAMVFFSLSLTFAFFVLGVAVLHAVRSRKTEGTSD